MSKRNLVWLAVVVAGLVVGWVAGGWLVGVAVAVVLLVASEVVERTRRRRLADETGSEVPSVRRAITSQRKRRWRVGRAVGSVTRRG